MSAPVQLIPPALPGGTAYCPANWQQAANDFFTYASAILAGNVNTFNYGDATPSPDNRNRPWLRTIGGAPDRWYVWFDGYWVWPHEVPPSSDERRLWVGLEADLVTYDGGESAPVTDYTGPFWEVDHDFDARFLAGPGTFSPSGTSLAVNENKGQDQVTPTAANLPKHTHHIGVEGNLGIPDPEPTDNSGYLRVGGGLEVDFITPGTTPKQNVAVTRPTGQDATTVSPLPTLPPVRGIFVIKRTARVYRRV
jgi:hypothetical protein